jgi:uncharacterized membrane-anchored protein
MKILATTLGETGGDLVAQTLNVGYFGSSLLFITLFAISLVAQLRVKSFHPALFWAVILATSTAGTTMSDFMNRTAGLGYANRPFGANAGNTLSKTHDEGGLGLGTLGASGVLAALLVGLVVYQTLTSRSQTRELVPTGDDLAR